MATSYDWIDSTAELADYCARHRDAAWAAFDTEFVSEYSYQPQLCLIQVATPGAVTLIDPLALDDVAPFWNWLADIPGDVIVHAGRAEFEFCLRWAGRVPQRWFDVQIAAGLVGTEYPVSFRKLVDRFTGRSLGKAETRTDWRRRPLDPRQLEYACQDVVPLKTIADALGRELDRRNRRTWYAEEIDAWRNDRLAEQEAESWPRLSGVSKLSGRQRAVARALWRWREAEAAQRNVLPRRVLRDDLLVELARWETADPKRVRSLRGMEWRKVSRKLPAICRAIETALALPEAEWPALPARKPHMELGNQLPQFLYMAVASLCVAASVAPSLVATVQDIRDLIEHHVGGSRPDDAAGGCERQQLPRLARGWRAELVGNVVDDLLDGKLAIRIADPRSAHPVVIEAYEGRGRKS